MGASPARCRQIHAGKSGAQRGTSKKEDTLDTVIALRRPLDYDPSQGTRFEVHYGKNRGFYGDDAKPFEARLVNSQWLTGEISVDTSDAGLMFMKGQGLSTNRNAKNNSRPKAKRCAGMSRLRELARKHLATVEGVKSVGQSNCPACVPVRHLSTKFVVSTGYGDELWDTIKQRE